ncbi:MAG TPA: 16S rRNA (guanine(527)-N(7))-methyltransferase RsmG [Fodinibius sp.]|nr:16S rRNA (guanine(527)-N(7))-methyltransferase RsmG [Fodinibius sp.]
MEQHKIITRTVSRETYQQALQLYKKHEVQLATYIDRLLWWNKRINLVSRTVSRETVREHVAHSLLLSQFKAFRSSKTIVDAGTGGGLPGIPLAITCPDKQFLLNDIVSKKCLAMKQMVRRIGLANVQTADHSIASLQQEAPFLLISKHAFKINELYKMTSHLPWTSMMLYKGIDFEEELEGINKSLSIKSYELSEIGDFYKDKAIVTVTPS